MTVTGKQEGGGQPGSAKASFTFPASLFDVIPTRGLSHKSTETLVADTSFEALHIVPLPKVDGNNPPTRAD